MIDKLTLTSLIQVLKSFATFCNLTKGGTLGVQVITTLS